jgi:hypothetical protein
MKGKSGRVVVEIDAPTKRQLHSKLASEGRTLKDWFLERAEEYLNEPDAVQLRLKASSVRMSPTAEKL